MTNTPGGLADQPLALANAVTYNEGAVVSRTLVNQPGGTLTLFAFDADQELSEHTAPFDAVVQVLEGEVLVTLAGQPHAVRAGEALLMPAHVPHALKAATRFKMLLTMIRAAKE
jgi:quercetin dioxygenase-like cupin family protein